MRRKTNRRKRRSSRIAALFGSIPVGRILIVAVAGLSVVGVAIGGSYALGRLNAHVDGLVLSERPEATVSFIDMPPLLRDLALHDLNTSLSDLTRRPWTDDALCREMAGRLESVGWMAKVHFVRRTAEGVFEISGKYRLPVALVQRDSRFFLVDGTSVRLPGTYAYHPAWKIVQGVVAPPPGAGERWEAEDLSAGLDVLSAIRDEPFGEQITGVLVDNFAGRRDARSVHIELATDRSGGRIRWGSAPGKEVEENLVHQKIALLRGNYGITGRADATHAVIDISTFPDRYTIPG